MFMRYFAAALSSVVVGIFSFSATSWLSDSAGAAVCIGLGAFCAFLTITLFIVDAIRLLERIVSSANKK